jgi:type IV pilus assembly protein PilA
VVLRLTERTRSERGFTLIELLIVILVIGILAGIAIPIFLGSRDKGYDADAKSNARNLVSQVESCYTPNEDFRDCDSAAKLGDFADGIDYGSSPGQVEVQNATKDSFQVVAVSKSQTNGVNHVFTISRDVVSGANDRTCTTGGSNNDGGCQNGAW